MDLPDTIDLLQPSIVQLSDAEDVFADFQEATQFTQKRGGLGTGFVVNDDRTIVTARHVVEGVPPERLWAGFARVETEGVSSSFRYWGLEIVEKDPRHDLALLRLTGEGPVLESTVSRTASAVVVISAHGDQHERHPVALRPERPRAGTAIAVSGYPLRSPVLVTNAGYLATSRSINELELRGPGILPGFSDPDVADEYLADVQANPGNSGGPVYRIHDGSVIGVCVAGRLTHVTDDTGEPVQLPDQRVLFYDAGLTVIVPSRYVVELLKRHSLKWVPGDS